MTPDLIEALGRIVGSRWVRHRRAELTTYAMDGLPTRESYPGVVVVPADSPYQDFDDLLADWRGQLAAFKVPTVVHVVEKIPKTPTGKVQRPRMAAHFGEE